MPYRDNDGHILYKGICNECHFIRIARISDLKATTRCTHIRIDGKVGFNQTFWDNKRIGDIFGGIKQRCYNPKDQSYRWYGAKGIKICDEWMDCPKSFEEWSLHNGYADNLTIDRIEEDKDYCPENCRWVTTVDNTKYKSTTSSIEINGEIHTGRDWARKLGLGINVVNKYIKKHGLENTKEFIKRYTLNPELKKQAKNNQSYYDLYMNNK